MCPRPLQEAKFSHHKQVAILGSETVLSPDENTRMQIGHEATQSVTCHMITDYIQGVGLKRVAITICGISMKKNNFTWRRKK